MRWQWLWGGMRLPRRLHLRLQLLFLLPELLIGREQGRWSGGNTSANAGAPANLTVEAGEVDFRSRLSDPSWPWRSNRALHK